MSLLVRSATAADLPQIEALLRPQIAAGAVLPRTLRPEELLVATDGEALVGTVALAPWRAGVAELGALVAGSPGQGVGRRLVAACLERAAQQGYHTVVALTGTPGFFERVGFVASELAPHQVARREVSRLDRDPLGAALAYKAGVCGACPRLDACRQVLLCAPVTALGQQVCA